MGTRKNFTVGAGVSLAATLGLVASEQAQDFQVDNLGDPSGAGGCTAVNDGDCSLRQALDNATLTAGDDTVTFKSGLTGNISLSGNILIKPTNLADAVTVTGPGAGQLTVSGPPTQEIFQTYSTVNLSQMTLTGGHGSRGGAIQANGGSLSLDSMAITNSHSKYGGAVTVQNGTALTINRSTLSGNAADVGGPVSSDSGGALGLGFGSTTHINASTIAGNSAAYGGGIFSEQNNATVKINDSTISGNHASPGLITPIMGSPFLVGGDGGGIDNAGASMALYNSIVADNTSSPVDPTKLSPDVFGPVTSSASLIESTTGAAITTAPGSRTITGQDPKLGPLANNGGPTLTERPDRTSVVIDAGGPSLPSDQRGFARPFDVPTIANATTPGANGADMGAVELTSAEAIPEIVCSTKQKKKHHKGKDRDLALGATTAKKHHKKSHHTCGKKKHHKKHHHHH